MEQPTKMIRAILSLGQSGLERLLRETREDKLILDLNDFSTLQAFAEVSNNMMAGTF